MPSFAAAQQMPVQRQLLELGVTQHYATQQYLLPAPPSLPEAFQLLYDYQPTPFHEHSTYGDQSSTNVPVSQLPPPDDPLVTVGDIEDILQNLSQGGCSCSIPPECTAAGAYGYDSNQPGNK